MKIFYPLEVFYPSQAGGPANTIYWIAKNISKHGFQPIIVATDKGIQPEIPLNKWIEFDGCRAIYIKTRFLHFPIYQVLIALKHFYRADIIHISSFFYPTAFVIAIASRILNKKIVWSARGELDTKALKHSKHRKRPILWLIKKLIGVNPLFHSTCNEETEYIKTVFGENAKVTQIPNFIEIPSKTDRQTSNYLLYIGRIHPKKAIDNLIRGASMSNVFLKSDFILKIAGKGKNEFEVPLHKLVKELGLDHKIIFAGQIEGEEKQQLLASAYFTIMPSHTENFGIVVLESLAQNTPVIASKGSPWKVLEEENIGFWVDNSIKSIAQKIDEILLMKPEKYNQFRNLCRDFVIREYDIQENIVKWVDVYKGL
jgi:glycosyltransferase involved in cell wall biosynthesis